MIVTIHQPEHLPWLGFFHKAAQSDLFVLLDQVQYRKNYFQNRNRLRAARGAVWVTVPVLTKGRPDQMINEVEINGVGSPRWAAKYWRSLEQLYGRAPYWAAHAAFFSDVCRTPWARLNELNERIIHYLFEAFGLSTRTIYASALNVSGQRSELLLDICRKVGAQTYVSGISGRTYLDREAFARAGIDVRFQEFHHPIYRQLHEPFMPCMAAVDLLFNYGPASAKMLNGVGVATMEHTFE